MQPRGLNNIIRESGDKPKAGNFIINDIQLDVPPTSISIHKEGLHYSMRALRTSVSTKILSGNGIYHIQVKITFPQDSILSLHRLICQVKNNPFVSIQNQFISESMGNTNSSNPPEAFTVMNLQVANHATSPFAFNCELDLRLFNYRPYTRYFGYKGEVLETVRGSDKIQQYAHGVVPTKKKGELFYNRLLVKEKTTNTTQSIRPKKEDNENKSYNVNDDRFRSLATQSNAYKRYSNFLQFKSLLDHFNIDVNDSISPEELSPYTKGRGDPLKVLGLNEELSDFTKGIIAKILEEEKGIQIHFKNFRAIKGNPDFINRLNKAISYGTKGENAEDAKDLRKKNFEEIQGLFQGNKTGTSNPKKASVVPEAAGPPVPERTRVALFYQIDLKERGIKFTTSSYSIPDKRVLEGTSVNHTFSETASTAVTILEKNDDGRGGYLHVSKADFFPITVDAMYLKDPEFPDSNTYAVKTKTTIITAAYITCQPIFAPEDGELSLDSNDAKTNKGRELTYTYKNTEILDIVFVGLDYTKVTSSALAEVKKGDLLGYATESWQNYLERTGDNESEAAYKNVWALVKTKGINLIDAYKITKSKPKVTKKKKSKAAPKATNKSIGPGGFLKENDLSELKKLSDQLSDHGFKYNETRSSYLKVIEKYATLEFPIGGTQDAIELLIRGGTTRNGVALATHDGIVTNVSGSIRHLMASIPVLGLESPTHQFLGSMEPNYQISFIGKDPFAGGLGGALKELEKLRHQMMFNSRNFNFVPDSGNIIVETFITKLLGSYKVSNNIEDIETYPNMTISSTDTFNVEGTPRVAGLHLRFSESKSFNEEEIGTVKSSELSKRVEADVIEHIKSKEGQRYSEVSFYENIKNNHSFYDWKAGAIDAKIWYRYTSDKVKTQLDDKKVLTYKLDKQGYYFCRDYLEPLQAFLKHYGDIKKKKYRLKFKPGGTFDSSVASHRSTKSNHFANVAADIVVEDMNAKVLAAIIVYLFKTNVINTTRLRGEGDSGTGWFRKFGLGLYGSDAQGGGNLDFSTKMNKANRKTGFIHLDANFHVTDQNKLSPDNIEPGTTLRRWVGDSGVHAFRIDGLDKNPTRDAFFYGQNSVINTIITNIKSDLDQALTAWKKEAETTQEALVPDVGSDSGGDEDSKESEHLVESGKQESNRFTSSKSDLEKLEKRLEETSGAKLELERSSYEDIKDNYNLPKKVIANSANYDFIILTNENPNSSKYQISHREDTYHELSDGTIHNTGKKLNKLKTYLGKTHYLLSGAKKGDDLKDDAVSKVIILPKQEKFNHLVQQRKELEEHKIKIDNMLNMFEMLASLVLAEPYLYKNTKAEADKELTRINDLLGLKIVPCLFNYIEANLVGSGHLGQKELDEKKQDRQGIDKRVQSGLRAGASTVGTAGLAIAATAKVTTTATALAAGTATVLGTLSTGGVLLLALGGAYLTTLLIDENNDEQYANTDYKLQVKRILAFFETPQSYDNAFEKGGYFYLLKNFFKFQIKRNSTELKSDINVEEFKTILNNLTKAEKIDVGIRRYMKLVFSKTPVFKYFNEIARDLKSDSVLRNLLRYKNTTDEDSEDVHQFLGTSLIDQDGIIREYLDFLFKIPYRSGAITSENVPTEMYYIEDDGKPKKRVKKLLENFDDFKWITDAGEIEYSKGENKYLFYNQVEEKSIGVEVFFNKSLKRRLQKAQEVKLQWLVGIKSALIETKIRISDDPKLQELAFALNERGNVFDSDTYPDITVPKNPKETILNRELSPVFYHWDSNNYSKAELKKINATSNKTAKRILGESLRFQKALSDGLYLGPRRGIKKSSETTSSYIKEKVDTDGSAAKFDSKEAFSQALGGLTLPTSAPDLEELKAIVEKIDKLEEDFDKTYKEGRGMFSPPVNNKVNHNNKVGTQNADAIDSLIEQSDDAYENFYTEDNLIKAFPTFKFYLVEEDKTIAGELLSYDDFYYYNSVIGFSYHNSRELPAQTATIRLQNISGTLDGTKKGELRDIDIDQSTRSRPYSSDDHTVVDSIVLRNGINVQLRAGYGSHSRDLSVLLNGTITEIKYSSDNMTCEVTVQSFGVELEAAMKNDFAKENDFIYNTTGEVLASLAYSEELKHFGRIKKGEIIPVGEARDTLVLDLEDTSETVSYAYSLFGGTLDWFERNAMAVTVGWVALELLGPMKAIAAVKFAGRAGWLGRSATKIGEVTAGAYTKLSGSKLSPLFWSGKAYRGANVLLGRTVSQAAVESTTVLGIPISRWHGKAMILGENFGLKAWQALTPYQQSRLAGNGVIGSLIRKGFGKGTELTKGIHDQLRLRYMIQTEGYVAGMQLLGNPNVFSAYWKLISNVSNAGRMSWTYNAFNVIPKTAGIVGFSVIPAVAALVLGAFGDLGSYLGGDSKEFIRRRNRLKKRIILSPVDDNLFPPRKESYYIKEDDATEQGIEALTDFGYSMWNNLTLGFAFFSGNELNEKYSVKKLLQNRLKMSSKKFVGTEVQYRIDNKNVWQVLHDLSLRHPGYVYGIRPYGEKFEYRMFFGRPNQRYYSSGVSSFEAKRINLLTDKLGSLAEGKLLDTTTIKELYMKRYKALKEGTNLQDSLIRGKLTELAYNELKESNKRFKPFRLFHSVESHRNLIANNVITSAHNLINTVKVHYTLGSEKGPTDDEANKEDIRTMKLKASSTIPPELERPKTVRHDNIRGIGAANRYGLGELLYGSKEMYSGSLLILGDAKINPWDVIILNDRVSNIYGPLEVKAVTHMFSHDTGFLTDIEVNAVTSANDYFTLPMIKQSIIYEARKRIYEKNTSRVDFLTGDEQEDKARLKESIKKTIGVMVDDGSWKRVLGSTTNLAANSPYLTKELMGLFTDPNANLKENKQTEEFLDNLTNSIYDSYKNPESINFLNDVVLSQGAAPEEIGELGNVAARAIGLPAVGMGSAVIVKKAYDAYYKNLGVRGGALLKGRAPIAIAVGALLYGLAETDILKDATSGLAKKYFDRFLGENLVKPFVLGKVSEESALKIFPLVKDGKPLLAGGLEAVSDKEKWNSVLGNFYNHISDGYQGFMRAKGEYQALGAEIIQDDKNYSWIERRAIDAVGIAGEVLGIDENIAVGYFHNEEGE